MFKKNDEDNIENVKTPLGDSELNFTLKITDLSRVENSFLILNNRQVDYHGYL